MMLAGLFVIVVVGYVSNKIIGDMSPCPPFVCEVIDKLLGVD